MNKCPFRAFRDGSGTAAAKGLPLHASARTGFIRPGKPRPKKSPWKRRPPMFQEPFPPQPFYGPFPTSGRLPPLAAFPPADPRPHAASVIKARADPIRSSASALANGWGRHQRQACAPLSHHSTWSCLKNPRHSESRESSHVNPRQAGLNH